MEFGRRSLGATDSQVRLWVIAPSRNRWRRLRLLREKRFSENLRGRMSYRHKDCDPKRVSKKEPNLNSSRRSIVSGRLG